MFSSIQENSDVTGFKKGQERQSAESALILLWGFSTRGKLCIFSCGSSTILPAHHSYLRCWQCCIHYRVPLMSNEQIINFEGCVLTFLLCSGFHCSCALLRSWRAIIISDNTWWLFGKRCVWMFACLQCTVCILNASSPCAPRVKKIRPIVGLLVVSVDTLRLEEASIYIDPPHFEMRIFQYLQESLKS